MSLDSRRYIFVPDTQVKPGVPLDHIDWIAEAICEYEPDVVVIGGDWWDMHSLCSHSSQGELEGARYLEDIESGNEAFERLCVPMEKKISSLKRTKKPWNPRKAFLFGNHEHRIDRAISSDPKWEGTISLKDCDTRDFERFPFLERVWLDGICTSHYFQASHSNRPIGGSIDNRLNKIGCSFVSFHEQGRLSGSRLLASGAIRNGLVVGSAYLHRENYRGNQGQRHWRGIVVANDVKNGEWDEMPLSLRFLARKYAGVDLATYMTKKYGGDWSYLE